MWANIVPSHCNFVIIYKKRIVNFFSKVNNINSKTIFFVINSWFFGRRPEFVDPKLVAQGEGREGENFSFIQRV